MNKYEMALVISAKPDDETRAGVLERAKGYIERGGGVVGKVQEWGKKRLAYEIDHQREGYYYFISFEAEADCPAEVERHARIMDHVLRYLIVRQENEFIVEPPADEPEPAEESAPAPAVTEEVAAAAEEPAAVAEEAAGEAAEATEETVAEATEAVEEAAGEAAEAAEEAAEAAEESVEEAAAAPEQE